MARWSFATPFSDLVSRVRSFSRLGPRRTALDYDGMLLATVEKVGSQFLSLRQRVELSAKAKVAACQIARPHS